MSRPRRLGHLAINLLLALAGVFSLFVALEAGARVFGLRKGLFIHFTGTCLRRSALLGFEQKPGCRLNDNKGRPWLSLNSLGQRGAELRDDGSIRILAVGDSSTFGWGKTLDGESYPARLERLLEARRGAGRYQVINTGVPGWTSYQGVVYLRERGLALHPSVVVVSFGFNDALRSGDDEQRTLRHAALMPLMRLDDWLLQRSIFYSWFRWQLYTATAEKQPHRVSPEKYRANLSEMVRMVRESGAKVLFLRFPQPTEDQLAHLRVLEEVGRDLGVPIVGYDGPRIDAVHPTAEGYQTVAESVFSRMEAEGFLE